jgi:uncharacterized protein (UPF0332 family)
MEKDKVINKFESLLKEGMEILKKEGYPNEDGRYFPDTNIYFRYRTEALNIIRRSCGEDSDHYRELRRLAESVESANNSYYFINCYGVLEAAKNDYVGGYILDLKTLVAAEVLGDFIEQADFLLEQGYFIPAASLAGAIMEDTLRKLCLARQIATPEKTKIDRLNIDLAKAGVYDKLIQKRITALADIRNNADHGHFDKFKKEDVEDMLSFLKRFTADYLE